jgi:divalent metal cation (Fe/Co/Zn/Cd) transporter
VTRVEIKPEHRVRERAVQRIFVLDAVATAGMLIFAILADSLTMIAEGVRGFLLLTVELIALITLRRIHRGRFAEYDFGTGKIERLVNVAIAAGLFVAAISIARNAFARLDHQPSSSAVYFVIAALFVEYNVIINVYGMISFLRVNQEQPSIIVESQIAARSARTTASVIVFVIALLSGVIPDPTVGNFLDVVGTGIVCVLMVRIGMQQLRESLPDLLDRALPDVTQRHIYRVLADNYAGYDDVVAVRSRRSGEHLLVEVELGFRKETTMAQVTALQDRLAEQIRSGLPEARLHVVPALTRWGPGHDPRLSLRQVMGRTMARTFGGPADATD